LQSLYFFEEKPKVTILRKFLTEKDLKSQKEVEKEKVPSTTTCTQKNQIRMGVIKDAFNKYADLSAK
jgi:hypothetical protein